MTSWLDRYAPVLAVVGFVALLLFLAVLDHTHSCTTFVSGYGTMSCPG